MLQIDFLRGYQLDLLIDVGLALLAGFLIGAERESRGKPAGISYSLFCNRRFYDFYVFVGPCRSEFFVQDSLLNLLQGLVSLVRVLFLKAR